mgnify:CR=1 FL=1
MAIGAGLVNYANDLMLLTLGMTFVGIGFGIVMPAVMMIIGMIVSPTSFAAASGVLMAFMNVGGFVSTYYIAFLSTINSAMRFPIFVAMLAFGISAIIYSLTQLKAHLQLTKKHNISFWYSEIPVWAPWKRV